jgi:hypothetical protein
MHSDTKRDLDPFTFSLRGIKVVNSHAMAPVIADNGINEAEGALSGHLPAPAPHSEPTAATRQVETLLARYFAHGCCDAA